MVWDRSLHFWPLLGLGLCRVALGVLLRVLALGRPSEPFRTVQAVAHVHICTLLVQFTARSGSGPAGLFPCSGSASLPVPGLGLQAFPPVQAMQFCDFFRSWLMHRTCSPRYGLRTFLSPAFPALVRAISVTLPLGRTQHEAVKLFCACPGSGPVGLFPRPCWLARSGSGPAGLFPSPGF